MAITIEFEPKSDLVSEVTFLDTSDNKCKLVSTDNPLPTQTMSSTGAPTYVRVVGASGEAVSVVEQPDGSYALKVDTEVTLNADNVTVGNVKVGYNGTDNTLLATTSGGYVKVVDTDGTSLKPSTGIVKQYTVTTVTSAGSGVPIVGTAVSILVTNISTTDDGQVSFTGGAYWYDIPKNYGGIAIDSNTVAKIQLTSSDVYVRSKTAGTIDVQAITVEV